MNKHRLIYTFSQLVALCLILWMSPPLAAAPHGDEIPNAAGGLRIGWVSHGDTTVLVDEPTLLKDTMDQGWLRLRTEVETHVVQRLNAIGSQYGVEVRSALATLDDAELRLVQLDTGVSLKHVLHHNSVWVTIEPPWAWGPLSYLVTFDIETVLAVQATGQGQRLQFADAVLTIRNVQIEGLSWSSDLAYALFAPFIEASLNPEGQVNMSLLPLLRVIDRQLAPVVPKLEGIPQDIFFFALDVEPKHGAVVLCFKDQASAACRFPPLQEE